MLELLQHWLVVVVLFLLPVLLLQLHAVVRLQSTEPPPGQEPVRHSQLQQPQPEPELERKPYLAPESEPTQVGASVSEPLFQSVHVGSPLRADKVLLQRRHLAKKAKAKPNRAGNMGCCSCSRGNSDASKLPNHNRALESSLVGAEPSSPNQLAGLHKQDAGTAGANSYDGACRYQRVLGSFQNTTTANGTDGLGHSEPCSARSPPSVQAERPWLAGIAGEELAQLDEMRSEGSTLLATANPDDPLLRPSREADRDGVLLRYLRARKTIPEALEQLRRGIAWRRAMKVHEWHQPSIVSPRGILADPCSQVYCCDSGYRDRQGRPYMVGAIDLFDGPTHDPDKHLLAIYYVLERLVVNFRWPECPSFCYVLDMATPPDPPKINFDVPCEVPYPKHGTLEGLNTLRRGLGVAQMAYPEVLDTVYVLNAGFGFQWAWKIFSVRS